MHLYFNFFGFTVPGYGLMITIGIVLANLLGLLLMDKYGKKRGQNINELLVLEAYILLGGFGGAKLLYLLVSAGDIDWSRITDFTYLNQLIGGGFVFYGGLIGGIAAFLLAGKIHHFALKSYMDDYICFIPFIHCFGRLGCFMAGCCYGIPWDGPLAVVFPEESFAPAGIPLFPVQLVEAGCCMVIALATGFLRYRRNFKNPLAFYILTYGIVRFILEYFRYDEERGGLGIFSTSQIISILAVILAVCLFIRDHIRAQKPQQAVEKRKPAKKQKASN